MRSIIKKTLALIVTVFMALSMLPLSASASEYIPPRSSNVVFRASPSAGDFRFSPGTFYSDTDLFKTFKNVMPGDVLEESILITNNSQYNAAEIYLKAVPHGDDNPMSSEVAKIEESVASMEDFLSQLYMTVYNNEDEVIFAASPEKTAGLTEPINLGRVTRGNLLEVRVVLEVPKNLGNKYAYRAGEVDWVFYAEVFANPGIGGGGGSGEPDYPVVGNNLTVKKYWKDADAFNPASVTVYLTRDGEIYDEAVLSGVNQWTYTWTNLDDGYDWDAKEDVPDGYEDSYLRSGNLIMITNTRIPKDSPIDPEETTPGGSVSGEGEETAPGVSGGSGDNSDPDETTPGGTGGSEGTDKPGGEGTGNPDGSEGIGGGAGGTVTPGGTGNGEPDGSEGIGGIGTQGGVDADGDNENDSTSSGSENQGKDDSEDQGATAEGGSGTSDEPIDISVRKEWAGDEESLNNRPAYVIVTLLNGVETVDRVYLGDHNLWTYTWKNLDPEGDWTVVELDIPKSYTPSYLVEEDGTVVITNTASLIQTGQMKWHIPVISGVGAAFVLVGFVLIFRKRKQENE